MARASLGKKIGIGALAVVVVGVVLLYTTAAGKAIRDIAGTGAIQDALTKPERRTYDDKDTVANLQALGTGLKLYEASEGQYPDADKWMDQLEPRLILNDLPKKEADKKLVRPGLGDGEYGYAINDAAAGKFKGDLPKGTILVFESRSTAHNAHGDPKKDGLPGGRAITIEGETKAL